MAGPADGSTGLIAVIWAARAARTWTVLEPAGRELLSVTIEQPAASASGGAGPAPASDRPDPVRM